jgi:antitoxin component of MazEF toxin-antitoxin module
MIQKLRRHGDELALVLDRELLAAHGIDEETSVEVAFSGTTMIVTASMNADRKLLFDQALAATNDRFGPALRRLAE